MGKCYVCQDKQDRVFQYYTSQTGELLLDIK
jgi:hypothetical protein